MLELHQASRPITLWVSYAPPTIIIICLLAACWPLAGRLLAACWPRAGRVLAASWPLPGRHCLCCQSFRALDLAVGGGLSIALAARSTSLTIRGPRDHRGWRSSAT